jgi:hypothetical protein
MQPIVHFLLSIVAGLGIGLHLDNKKDKVMLIFLLALITCAIDADHLLPGYSETGLAIFHNIFVFILLPAELFLVFFILERQKSTSIKQRSALILSVMFMGAMLTDGISESGMPLFYPLRTEMFGFINMRTELDATVFSLTSGQVILILWGCVIAGANLLETLIFNDVEGRSTYLKKSKAKHARKSWLPVIISGIPIIGLANFNKSYNSRDEKEGKKVRKGP